MAKVKKCKYCGDINNLYKYSSGYIINCCVDHYNIYIEEKNKKRNLTNLEKYGAEYPMQNKDIQKKTIQTNLEKYGVENPSQSNIIKDKKRKTILKNYGVENISQSKDIQDKKIVNSLKKYGTKYPMQNKDIQEKQKQTNLEKYGVEYTLHTDEIKEKTKQTNLKKYGTEHVSQNKDIQKKIKQTCLEKYGVENAQQNKDIREKTKQTNLKKYGVEYILQNKEIYIKGKKTNIEKYGVEHASQNKDIQEKQKKTNLKKYGVEYILQNKEIRKKIRRTLKNDYWKSFVIKLNLKKIYPLLDKEYYINNDDNFKYKCLKCNNEFISDETNPQKIICYNCDKSKSLPEYEIEDWLKSLNINLNIQRNKWIYFNTKDVKRREIDILINDKIAIFYHGLKWHSDLYKDKNFHQQLFKLFTKEGYMPIQIFENEWLNKQDIVKSIILSKLNINQTKIYARKTIIKEIDNKSYQLFLEQNHIQGYGIAKIKLGMFLNGKLISILGLGKSRFKKNETEVIRYCSKLNYQVTGGLAKFLKYIKNNYNFDNIISYIDLRYFDGSSYIKNGFKLELVVNPNYYYFKNSHFKLHNRIQFQKHKLKNKLDNFDPKLSEYENMLNNNYLRIFDAGNYKLRLNL